MTFLYVIQHSYVSLQKIAKKFLHFPGISITKSSQIESAHNIQSQVNK